MMYDCMLRLADMNIGDRYRFPYFYKFAGVYLIDEGEAQFQVEVTDEELEKEKDLFPEFHEDYIESLCIYRKMAEILPDYGRMVFHGAVITCEGRGYLFTAPSGTGKSTHIRQWRKYLGDKVDIVNGDKPILAVCEDETGVHIRAYGTPWAGKERWQKNHSAEVEGICFLKQGEKNTIRRLEPGECLYPIMHQVYLPSGEEETGLTLELLDKVISHVPFYSMECDISKEAVKCSYEAMTGSTFEE